MPAGPVVSRSRSARYAERSSVAGQARGGPAVAVREPQQQRHLGLDRSGCVVVGHGCSLHGVTCPIQIQGSAPWRRPAHEPNKTAIYSTALTAFFAIAGIAIVDPILPAIGAAIGASTWQIELLFTAYIAVMAVGMIPAVMATGKFGYKKVLATGVSTVAVAAILASLSSGIVSLAVLRGLWGLGNAMFFATAMVLLVSLANDKKWVVELFETCVGLGFAIGPLIGGLLGQISWRVPFFLCGLFMIAALIISLTRLKDPEEMPAPLRLGQVFHPFRRPAFVALCVITATYNFVFFIVLGFTPIFLGLDVVPAGPRVHGVGRRARLRHPGGRAPARAPVRRRADRRVRARWSSCSRWSAWRPRTAPRSPWSCSSSPASAWASATPTSPTSRWPPARPTAA